ncbi:hypothetical protein [uncultured Eudoraea sp.]|uniref:hypothetical protein n=1 Tax=uncultured Eudoraea sp. TaxID=1035614 RepID=UPI00262D7A09|nr:hypothetical protein [uncultured Eudoraea sp.]
MKQIVKQLALLERVDQLIRLKATGRPNQLARRLQVSEATVFRIIDTMKEMNAPVCYDLTRQSYIYEAPTKFKCGFYLEVLDEAQEKNLSGGIAFIKMPKLLSF